MQNKNWLTPVLLGITIVLGVASIMIAQRLFSLKEEPVTPNVPKSKPQAQSAPTATPVPSDPCLITFSITGSTPTPTPTPPVGSTPTPTVTITPPVTVTNTPTPEPTTTPPGCGGTCDTNNNRCPSDAPYCVDYSNDILGPICGKQTLAGEGPKCETPPPSCGSSCDLNNNRCPSDAPYCVDYSNDTVPAICGRQPLATEGAQCLQITATPALTPVSMPPAGIIDNTIWAIVGGASFILLGLLFL